MKKYVLRKIGWIFDDDWHNYDGEYQIEGIYDTREEAVQQKRLIDYAYFRNYFEALGKFQLNRMYTGKAIEFVDVKEIIEYIAPKNRLDKAELLQELADKGNRHILDKLSNDINLLSMEEVQQLLALIKVEFAKLLVFDTSTIHFHIAKKNPEVWGHHESEYYRFYDEYDEQYAFQYIIQCYESALTDPHDAINGGALVNNPEFMKGELTKLSDTPDLLNNLIAISEHINYDEAHKAVLFDHNVTAEELMGIDAALKEPILLIEKQPIEKMKFLDEDRHHQWVMNQLP